jgi:DNA polymerase V
MAMSKSALGRRHRQAREEILTMSVSVYAGIVGVKEVTVYSWESGRTTVPHDVLATLASRYGISLTWLLTGVGEPTDRPVVLRGARRSDRKRSIRIPMLSLGVSAGSPTVAEDTVDREIDLAEMLLEHPDSTYFIRVVGDSMTGAGIADGDMLIVDCALQPKAGQIVIAKVYGELTVKRYLMVDGAPYLRAENKKHKDIPVTPDMDFAIVGVVRSCIKQL